MMATRLYLKASALCANRATNFVQTASRVAGSTSIGPNYFYNGGVSTANNGSTTTMMNSNPFQQQQQRFKMTKAKIKRTIRHRRRKVWAEKGKELPKPPGYMPRDLPVVNVIPRDIMQEEIQKNDEQDKKEIEERRMALAAETPLRHHMTGLTMSDRVRKLFDMNNGNQKEVVQYQKESGMRLFRMREGDTGSTAVQVVALTSRIQQLQTHMREHKKDQSTKRGLLKLTVRRRKLLDYMERKDFDSYRRVVKSLGLARR